tara:strand:- start:693 stop:1523 length:831 start_codon:yes stop_codon:yes gene_type:complete
MVLFTLGLTVGSLAIENEVMEKKRRDRTRSLDGKRRQENSAARYLQSVENNYNNVNKEANKWRRENAKWTRAAIREESIRDDKKRLRNRYRDVIIPRLKNTKRELESELRDTKVEHKISDAKNTALLDTIVNSNESLEKEKLKIYGKTQQLHNQINKQNTYLEQTFQNLTQKRINLDRRSTYEEHIKTEYMILNVFLWYVYYILFAFLLYTYHRQDKLKESKNVAIMVGLLLFPYWKIILNIIIDIITNIGLYVDKINQTLGGMPKSMNKMFESLF